MTRDEALSLFLKYNHDSFHLRHALTVEGVMKWFAGELGYAREADFWGNAGLLHDIDFEAFPEEHCRKAPELLHNAGADKALIHAVCSHGWNLTVAIRPEHKMEKVLYAIDELTGLVWATALMRPSKSVQDLELKSVCKKFRSRGFAAGCSREVIEAGADMLGLELDDLIAKTILAMRACENFVSREMARINH
ncbi:MAG: hydrolase [Victivallaceae bacterium]|nr:hydrolase [Victivallaceae bacterium]